MLDIGLLHHLEELARVGRKALDITPLPLGIDRVEREARLARARQPGDDDQTVARQRDIEALEIMLARAANRDVRERHGSALFQIYQAFASPAETEALRTAYAHGIAWGEVKQLVSERIDQTLAPLRARYEALIQDPAHIENNLRAGAKRARAIATPFLRELRHAVGLRSLAQGPAQQTEKPVKPGKAAPPSFKQYREADGKFYFKLVSPQGRLLLQSTGFDSPRTAGQAIAQLQQQGALALHALAAQLAPVAGVTEDEVAAALQALQDAAQQA